MLRDAKGEVIAELAQRAAGWCDAAEGSLESRLGAERWKRAGLFFSKHRTRYSVTVNPREGVHRCGIRSRTYD